jgi:hypothetical protein
MSTPDAERREMRIAGTWIGLVLAAIVTVAIVGVVDWLVLWGHSSTCHDAPDPDEARAGRLWLAGAFLLSALPWGLGAAMSRHRVPVAVVGAFAVMPGLLVFLYGLGTGAWVGSFCF